MRQSNDLRNLDASSPRAPWYDPIAAISDPMELLSCARKRSQDLFNAVTPPSLLAPTSTTEIPSRWTEQPSAFAAPALEEDPARRMLLVLKWVIGSLKSQYYIGEDPELGMKKPLNPFLGELFLARWEDAAGTTQLVSEQVRLVVHIPQVRMMGLMML